MAAITVDKVEAGYGGDSVLRGVTLALEQGEMAGLLGANGSGKTTLFRTLTGFLPPTRGTVSLFGRSVAEYAPAELGRTVALLPQVLEVPFSFTVDEVVAMGRFPHLGRFAGMSAEDRTRVHEALERADVLSLRQRVVNELSGGERQRVLLAQALAQDPRILLLDEPAAFLDVHHQVELFECLSEVNGQGVTVLAILHDLNLASQYLDRLVVLHGGVVAADGPPADVIRADVIERAFGVRLEVRADRDAERPDVYYKRVKDSSRP